jgi:hypothetical protein
VAIYTIIGLTIRACRNAGWLTPGMPGLPFVVQLLILYVPKELALVIGGSMTAPRARMATAGVLSAAAILMSLTKHVLSQRHTGWVNYTHFAAESAGSIAGVLYIFWHESNRRDRPRGQSGDDRDVRLT